MIIDWFKLVSALVILLVPIGVFHGKRVRYRDISRDWGDHLVPIFSLGLHLVDALRAALGTWLLLESVARVPGAKGLVRYAPLLFAAGVLWLGVTLQAIVCKERDAMHAPFAYVLGVVAAYVPPLVATFALILTLAATVGSRAAAIFFPVFAVALGGLGYLLAGKQIVLQLGVVGVMLILPWLLPVMFSREVVIAYRARRTPTSTPTPQRLQVKEV